MAARELISEAHDRLTTYLNQRGLKYTKQRDAILESFLDAPGHLTSEELYELVRESNPDIGAATVYRTLKLLVSAGIATQNTFRDGITVYEHFGHHHDHLICLGCGEIVEFECDEIERRQIEIARTHGYRLTRHRHHLFGFCPRCQADERDRS